MIHDSIYNFPLLVDELLQWGKANYPDKTAIADLNTTYTYEQLDRKVSLCALKLRENGISPGDKIAIQVPNSCNFVIFLFATLRLGAVAVPLYENLTSRELEAAARTLNLQTILTLDTKFQKNSLFYCTHFRRVLYIDFEVNVENQMADAGFGETSVKNGHNRGTRKTIDLDPALIIFTSSSSGRPKAIVLSHRNILMNCISNVKSIRLQDDDRTLIYLPLSYLYSLSHQLFSTLLTGGTVHITDEMYLPNIFVNKVMKLGITFFAGTPFIYYTLIKYFENRPDIVLRKFLRLATVGGDSINMEAVKRIQLLMPDTQILLTYGLTEHAPRVCTLPHGAEDDKLSSVGLPLPNVDVDFVSSGSKEGELKELRVRSSCVMMGYYQTNGEYIPVNDHTFMTGDVGFEDDEGFIYIRGRNHDIIKHKGYKIFPKEVEEVMMSHPHVVHAKVEQNTDSLEHTALKASVICSMGKQLTKKELLDHCRNKLSNYKIPSKIKIKQEFTINRNYKISSNKNGSKVISYKNGTNITIEK